MRRVRVLLLILALAWIAALVQRGQPLGWDEVEYFRATRWVSEGAVPYRDFWEHHTPLQWLVFAPVAAFFGDGPGVGSILALRWAQVAVWAGIFAMLHALARRLKTADDARAWALLLPLTSVAFLTPSIEFRVDVLGNALFFAGLLVAFRARSAFAWSGSGCLLALSVLANMRAAPLVIATALLFAFWSAEQRRWRWNPQAWAILPGAAVIAGGFLTWLYASGAWKGFVAGVLHYNLASADVLEVDTFFVTLLAPLWRGDVAGVAFWALGLGGAGLALRDLRHPGPAQLLVLILCASLLTVGGMQVQYEYHFQNAWLLMVPLAGLAIERLEFREWIPGAVVAVGLLLGAAPLAGGFGEPMAYQDLVMRDVDARTTPAERVFDPTGYALRRKPAYDYWFLTTGVRVLAARGELPPYRIQADPPAALLYNLRMQRWFEIFPATAEYAVHHYVPLYRNLWVPGLSGVLKPGGRRAWRVPRAGRYRFVASPALPSHPWFRQPLVYAALEGPRATQYAIPLMRLPKSSGITWAVNGAPVRGEVEQVKRGALVEAVSTDSQALGVLAIPDDIAVLAQAPPDVFQF